MKTIAVTGGSGGAGTYIIRELLAHNYTVINLDRAPSSHVDTDFRQLDVADYGETLSALGGVDAVVHMAANPDPDHDMHTAHLRFHNNTLGAYNLFQASAALGIKRVVWGSSETIHGFPFLNCAPVRVPVTEEDPPQPQNAYALSKWLTEKMAEQMSALYGMTIIGLRYSNILYDDDSRRDNYSRIPDYWADRAHRKFNLWSYIDAGDAARSTRLALESELQGAETFIIGAADTLMNCPSRELADEFFPDAELDKSFGGFDSFISSDKARRMLGFEPRVSWRDILSFPENDGVTKSSGKQAV
ncbi:MAG: NAD-dependent epimerase/dehydratase family protein [bacterium]